MSRGEHTAWADWQPIETAPRDGTVLDILFDPLTAEIDYSGRRPLSMAEFYAPGCTRKTKPTAPLIEMVEFSDGHFRPVTIWGQKLHGIMSVTPTHWRLHTRAGAQ